MEIAAPHRFPLDDILSVNVETNREEETTVELKRLLKRYTKEELFTDVPKLCMVAIDQESRSYRMDKDQLVELIVKLIKEEKEDLEEMKSLLRLKYIQKHAKSRMWSALEVENTKKTLPKTISPSAFSRSMEHFLNGSKYFCKVICQQYDDELWTLILFNKPGLKKKDQDTYLLHYAHIPFVLFCGLRVAHRDILHRALIQVFEGTEIKKLPINTRCISALLQLGWEKYEELASAPQLVQKQIKKRKVDEEPELPQNVINENSTEDTSKSKYLRQVFKSYERPALEVLTYNTKTDFYGYPEGMPPVKSFVCRVSFKGQNVAEGIRELVKLGAANYPLPEYIANVQSFRCNTFQLTENSLNNSEEDDS